MKQTERIIVTFDKYFADRWLFPPEEYVGIVFLKIRPPLITTALLALQHVFQSMKPGDFRGRLFIVSPIGFKIWPKEREQ